MEVKGKACIVCPWHESYFALDGGDVVHGPATSPQPVFDTRVVDGQASLMFGPYAGHFNRVGRQAW